MRCVGVGVSRALDRRGGRKQVVSVYESNGSRGYHDQDFLLEDLWELIKTMQEESQSINYIPGRNGDTLQPLGNTTRYFLLPSDPSLARPPNPVFHSSCVIAMVRSSGQGSVSSPTLRYNPKTLVVTFRHCDGHVFTVRDLHQVEGIIESMRRGAS